MAPPKRWHNAFKRSLQHAAHEAGHYTGIAATGVRMLATFLSPSQIYWSMHYRNRLWHTWGGDSPTGRARFTYDTPRRSYDRFMDQWECLVDKEKQDELNRPYLGVNHIYSPHLGSLERPLNFVIGEAHGNDLVVACEGECNLQVPETPIFQRVPANTLILCADCGFHFLARTYEYITLDFEAGLMPTGPQQLKFEEIEEGLNDHIIWGGEMYV